MKSGRLLLDPGKRFLSAQSHQDIVDAWRGSAPGQGSANGLRDLSKLQILLFGKGLYRRLKRLCGPFGDWFQDGMQFLQDRLCVFVEDLQRLFIQVQGLWRQR